MRALKMRSALASHWKLTMTNWEQSLKLILLQLHEKLLKNSTLTILWSFSIWSKLKKLDKWVPHELTESQKIVILKCCLLLFYATTKNHFLFGLWCVRKSGFYMTTGNEQHSGWTEKKLQSTSQSHTCIKTVMVIAWWSAARLDQLQFSESQWNRYIWDVGSVNWWHAPKASMPAAGIDQ